jgi:D-alanyl-D-alanine carboxypeptidase
MLARAMITRHAGYYRYFSTRQFDWKGQTIATHNRLMLRYPGADGIKTGYIHASGFNLISSAKHGDHRVIGVVFGGTTGASRDTHMGQLLDKGFARLNTGESVEVAAAPTDLSADDDLPDLDGVVAAAQGVKPAAKAKPAPAPAHKLVAAKPAPTKVSLRAPSRRDDEDSVGDADPDAWSIQIGAYKEYRPAQRAVAEATRTLGRLASDAEADITKVGRKGHQVYRARLEGFNERQARAACKRLDRAGISCRAIDPSA